MSTLGKNVRMFLSYARQDKVVVEKLYQDLSSVGFQPWLDIKDILPGENWKHKLINAIREAPFFLACISTNSLNKRGLIQEEIKEALEILRQKHESDIYIIPVRLEDCLVPEPLSKFQWVDLFEGDGFVQLQNAIIVGMERLGLDIPPGIKFSNQFDDIIKKTNFSLKYETAINQLNAFQKMQRIAIRYEPHPDHIFENLLDAVVEDLNYDYAAIALVDQEERMIKGVTGKNVSHQFLKSICHHLDSKYINAWVVRHRQMAYLIGWDERLDRGSFEEFNQNKYIRMITPIIARDSVVGTIEVGILKNKRTEVSFEEVNFIQQLVNLAGLALEKFNMTKTIRENIVAQDKQFEVSGTNELTPSEIDRQ